MRKVLKLALVASYLGSAAACGPNANHDGAGGTLAPIAGAGAGNTTMSGTGGSGGAPPPAGGTTGASGLGGGGTGILGGAGSAGGMMGTALCELCPECDEDCLYPDIRGTGPCAGLDSGWPGDDACLPAPEPGDGIQVHIGPANYKNVGDYEFAAGLENSQAKDFVTPNTEDLYYQGWVLSARTGTHHIINTCFTDNPVNPAGGFGPARDPGIGNIAGSYRIPGASKPYMPRSPVAPENQDLGAKLPANAQCQADMHYFNFTSMPMLREFWLNLYTKDPALIQQEAESIRGMGGTSWVILPIQPGSDMVYKYQFPPAKTTGANPRIVSLLGHYHAHGKRFTGYLNGKKIYEMFDYNDSLIFYYNSITENPPFAPEAMQGGATSGVLSIKDGDVLSWECHIINDSSTPLRYANEVNTAEMCNFWGASVDVKFDAVIP